MALTASMEDYLEAIFEIEKVRKSVRVKDVANKLGVTMPSVNGALKNLEARGYITHERYDHIELTESGQAQAARVASRHEMIYRFLRDILNVGDSTAQSDACRIEHVMSRETVDRMADYIQKYTNG
jgi:DtxR family Mn-dependent transcriptional regulator